MTLAGRYKKRPVTVDAQQWRPGTNIRGLRARFLEGVGHVAWFNDSDGEPHKVTPGDWIVRDNDGEMHVVPDPKFQALYEPVDT